MVAKMMKNINVNDVDGSIRTLSFADFETDSPSLPIVLLMGTSQTVSTYSVHTRYFSKNKRLLIPELRCQGQTTLLSSYATISQHVHDFEIFLRSLCIEKCQLVGYSFGGRVALAVAAHRPQLVERISITGVPLIRPKLGDMIMQSWRESLREGNLRDCAWSFLLNGCSESFIEKYSDKFPSFVDSVVKSNDAKRLYDLIAKSYIEDDNDPYSVSSCARHIRIPVQVIGSSNDRISGTLPVQQLAKSIKGAQYIEIENVGHLIPFESPKEWRSHVMNFLS